MNLSLQIEEQLSRKHKKLFTGVVMPVVLVTTIAMIAIHARWDMKFFYGVLVTLALDVFNIYFSIANRVIKTPFGTIQSRSDGFDTFRWCVNFPLDLFIVWSLEMSFTSAAFGWLILSFGGIFEVLRNRYRWFTSTLSFLCFVVLSYHYSEGLWPTLYVLSCFVGVLFILFKFERWLLDEMTGYFTQEQAKLVLESENEKMTREALVGSKTRMICHEINNLFSIMQMATMQLDLLTKEQDQENLKKPLARLDRAIGSLGRLSKVILDEIGSSKNNVERKYPISELLIDFETLLQKHFSSQQNISFSITVDPRVNSSKLVFKERAGTTYLIVHNLVKNSFEACEDYRKKLLASDKNTNYVPEIKIDCHMIGDQSFEIEVQDNGPGLSQEQIQKITSRQAVSSKQYGHGLGTRFVVEQINLNQFGLEIHSELSKYTRIRVRISCEIEPNQTNSPKVA